MASAPPLTDSPARQDSTSGALRVLFLTALTAAAIYLCWKLAAPFIGAFTWAFALAVACAPLRRWLFARMTKLAATLLIITLVVVVIAAPVTFIMRELLQESLQAQTLLKQSLDADTWQRTIAAHPWFGRVWTWADQQFDLSEIARQIAAAIARWIAPALAHSVGVISQAGVALLAFFYFLRDQESILTATQRLLPLSRDETGIFLARISAAVRSAVYGRLSVGFLQGCLGGLIFALVGLPAPVFWGAVMALLSLLPMLGAFVVWVPAGVYLAIGGHWIRAVIVAVWGLAIIHPVDNLLYPVLVGARMGLHPLVLFIAFVGGLIAFGPAGLILGPLIVAAAGAIAEVWEARQCRPSV
jgi:predicted PurR-regulated permease PerM